jgi:hypothetical protein
MLERRYCGWLVIVGKMLAILERHRRKQHRRVDEREREEICLL